MTFTALPEVLPLTAHSCTETQPAAPSHSSCPAGDLRACYSPKGCSTDDFNCHGPERGACIDGSLVLLQLVQQLVQGAVHQGCVGPQHLALEHGLAGGTYARPELVPAGKQTESQILQGWHGWPGPALATNVTAHTLEPVPAGRRNLKSPAC